MTHVSLFAGIGGIDLAAEWASFRTILQVEKDPYACKVLEKHWPDVPRIKDVRDVTRESVNEPVTLVSAGVPCQPSSIAGKRGGTTDDRWLWPEMLRVCRELLPRWIVAENPTGILSLMGGVAIEDVLSELEDMGYEILPPLVYPAAGVGANHYRYRVFYVAHAKGEREGRLSIRQGRPQQAEDDLAGCSEDAADAMRTGLSIGRQTGIAQSKERLSYSAIERCSSAWRAAERRVGELAHGFSAWLVEPDIPRVTTKEKDRVNKLRCLGNACMPQQIYPILAAIAEIEQGEVM